MGEMRESTDRPGSAGRNPWLLAPAVLLLVLLTLALGARPVAAQGGTCIDDVTGRINTCTANDVRLGTFYNVEPVTCTPGSTVSLFLRAELLGGANERYDIGLFVASDGGDARSGTCYQDYLPPPLAAAGSYIPGSPLPGPDGGPFLNAELAEDPTDACGDLEKGVSTFYDLAAASGGIAVPCVDTDGDGLLDIGACVSWDNNKQTTCLDLGDAVPSNKSKCRCELITVGNVNVEPGTIQVTKAPVPDNINEPGSDVAFTFTIRNTSDLNITITSLVDTDFQDLTLYPQTTCSLPQLLAPAGQAGDAYSCAIVAYISGPPGIHTNKVTASGTDQNGKPVTGSAIAEVVINNVETAIEVAKSADPPFLADPGGPVRYTIKVTNRYDTTGPVKLTGLVDDIYGDLMDPSNPFVSENSCKPIWIEPGGFCECGFTAVVTGTEGRYVVDTVTAYAEVVDSDTATVVIVPQPPPTGVGFAPPLLVGGGVFAGGLLLVAGLFLTRRGNRPR